MEKRNRKMEIEEKWQQSEEFPLYDVSDKGHVRNRKTGHVLKTYISDKGYERVRIMKDGTPHTCNIHKLVADTHVPGYSDGMLATHIDGNRRKNESDNLEWKTKKDISKSLFSNGKKPTHRMKPVRCIETGKVYNSIKDCSIDMKLNYKSVSKCANNRYQKTKNGYHFELIT